MREHRQFAIDRLLSEPRGGDIALIHDTGAHGHAMGFTYNRRLRPAELLITATGDVVEIRGAKIFDEYVATVRWQLVSVLTRHTSPGALRISRPLIEMPSRRVIRS